MKYPWSTASITAFPFSPPGNMRANRLRIPQSIRFLRPPRDGAGAHSGWGIAGAPGSVGRGPLHPSEGDRHPPVLLHPIQDDPGVRPLDVRVLERVLHEPVEVPAVAEPADQEGVVVARDVVNGVDPRVLREVLLDLPQAALRDPDPDRGPEVPAEL